MSEERRGDDYVLGAETADVLRSVWTYHPFIKFSSDRLNVATGEI